MAAVVVVILVTVLVTIFSVQNAMPVAISFLAWHFDASLAIIVLLFFLAGLITGVGIMFWIRIRRSEKKRSAESQKNQNGERSVDLK